jgi:hypothetical protein
MVSRKHRKKLTLMMLILKDVKVVTAKLFRINVVIKI